MSRLATQISRQTTRKCMIHRVALRPISTSTPRLAREAPTDPFADPKIKAFQDKLQQSPEALEAAMNVAKVLQAKGIDTSQGPPSTMQMMKLGLDSEVREAVKNMLSECQKAGLQIDMESIQAMAKRFDPK